VTSSYNTTAPNDAKKEKAAQNNLSDSQISVTLLLIQRRKHHRV
jgi:hypothetical protein